MAKSRLKSDLDRLEADIIETLLAGHHEWRRDLAYPESHSDMQGAVRGLLRMFEVKRRPVAVELEYHDDAPDMLAQHFRTEWRREVAEGKTQGSFEAWVANGGHWRDRRAPAPTGEGQTHRPEAGRIAAAIARYIGAQNVRYADRSRAQLDAHQEMIDAIEAGLRSTDRPAHAPSAPREE